VNPVTEQGAARSVDILSGFDSSSTIAAVRGIVANPTGNTTLSVLVLACVVLGIVIVALLVLALATPTRKKIVRTRRYHGERPADMPTDSEPSPEPASPPKKPGRVAGVLLSSGFLVALVAVALVGAYVSTSTHYYCAQTCHAGTVPVKSADKAGHAGCASCHESPGIAGVPANIMSRARMLFEYSTGARPTGGSAVADSGACLACHSEVESGVTTTAEGLRMSHAEVIEAALPCTSCHEGSGHVAKSAAVSMSECLQCHDERVASAECTVCHAQSPSSTVVVTGGSGNLSGTDYVYPAVRAAKQNCGGCHDEKRECDPCHGIRMPHTRDFREGAHARAAAFEAKFLCWKCHDPQWCSNGGCHGAVFYAETGDTTHGSDWKQEHKQAAWGAGCVCHQGRSNRDYPICQRCHAKNRELLPITP